MVKATWLLLTVCLILRGQATKHMQINVDPQTSKLVTLEEYDQAAYRSRLGRHLAAASVMLVNNTDRAIVAVRVMWSSLNPENPQRPRRLILTSDVFEPRNLLLPDRKPITAPHSRAIIGPGTVISDFEPKGGVISMSGPMDDIMHAGGPETTVTLDAVVFEDGEIIGPDTGGLGADLHARKDAATYLGL